jgi:hypothetical protein
VLKYTSITSGEFAIYEAPKTIEYVKANNIISFFALNDPFIIEQYGGKNIRLTTLTASDGQAPVVFEGVIADTCADSDCNNCCTENTLDYDEEFLVDLEYWTAINNLGGNLTRADGFIQFEILGN